MNKKYELSKEKYVFVEDNIYSVKGNKKRAKGNTKLRQLIALRDFGDVKAGDRGGYIGKNVNLDKTDESWIYPDSVVIGNYSISGNSIIKSSTIDERSNLYYHITESTIIDSIIINTSVEVCVLNNAEIKDSNMLYSSIVSDVLAEDLEDEEYLISIYNCIVSNSFIIQKEYGLSLVECIIKESVLSNNSTYGRINFIGLRCNNAYIPDLDYAMVVGPIGDIGQYISVYNTKSGDLEIYYDNSKFTIKEFEDIITKHYSPDGNYIKYSEDATEELCKHYIYQYKIVIDLICLLSKKRFTMIGLGYKIPNN